MSGKTKAELEAEVERLNKELIVRGRTIEQLRLQVAKLKPIAPAQHQLPLGFAAAREAAMRTGHSVKVEVQS